MEKLSELALEIIKITAETPNDMELGEKVRQLINTQKG